MPILRSITRVDGGVLRSRNMVYGGEFNSGGSICLGNRRIDDDMTRTMVMMTDVEA